MYNVSRCQLYFHYYLKLTTSSIRSLVFCICYGLFSYFSAQMSMHKKRKKDVESEWSGGKKRQRLLSNQRCILHASEVSNVGNFTNFIMCKPSPDEKLEISHNIQDMRLKEKAGSKHHMEDACKLIPDSLSDVDFENTGWHRGCHQRFTMNLNRLQSESQVTLEDAQPSSSRSPRKRRIEKITLRRCQLKNFQRNWRGSSILFSVEISQTLKNVNE